MECIIIPAHYYRHQMEVKKDLSDIWKEEDPDNFIRKKTWEGRQRKA
jgi:hypothetical protein